MKRSAISILLLSFCVDVCADTKFPLRVDVDVSAKRSQMNIGAGADGEAKVEQVKVRVKVLKTSSQPWEEPVSAELYVIGRQIHTGYFGIIDVQKGEFRFSKENDNAFEYLSPAYALGSTSGNINVGGEYETYLVVISDHTGKIVDSRCGRSLKDDEIEFIRKLGVNTLFDADGNIMGKADPKEADFESAVQSATDPGNSY